MSNRPLTVQEINDLRNLIREGKVSTTPADSGWYDPEELYETIELYREMALRLGQHRSVSRCPVCGNGTEIIKHAPMSDHPDIVDYYCGCKSCDWVFEITDITDAEMATAI